MSTAEKIENLINKFCETIKSSTIASEEMDKKVLNDALAIYEKGRTTKASHLQTNMCRIIIKSPITKLATAAVIIIACIAGLTMINMTSSVALAEVLENIKKVNAFFYQQKGSSAIQIMGMEMNQNMNSKVWMSQDYGMRMDMEMEMSTTNNPDKHKSLIQSYLIPGQNQVITIKTIYSSRTQ